MSYYIILCIQVQYNIKIFSEYIETHNNGHIKTIGESTKTNIEEERYITILKK